VWRRLGAGRLGRRRVVVIDGSSHVDVLVRGVGGVASSCLSFPERLLLRLLFVPLNCILSFTLLFTALEELGFLLLLADPASYTGSDEFVLQLGR